MSAEHLPALPVQHRGYQGGRHAKRATRSGWFGTRGRSGGVRRVFSGLGKGLAIVLLLLSQASGGVASPSRDNPANLARDALALEAEIRMAIRDQIYFILDIRDFTLRIKAAGLTLKRLPVARLAVWGHGVPPVPQRLVRKSALIEPTRPTIRPEGEKGPNAGEALSASERAVSALDVLEVKDMPTRFLLELDQGLRITVRPEPEGIFSRLWEGAHFGGWYLTRPFPTVWNHALRRPYTALYLRIAVHDARALYWSCREGTELLVINP